jgi:hypothetical protein
MKCLTFDTHIICDTQSIVDGHFYDRVVVENAIDEYTKNDYRVGMLVNSNGPAELDISKASHIISGLYIDDGGKLMAEIKLLDTESGKTVDEIHESLEMMVSSWCVFDDNNKIIQMHIIRFDLIFKCS